MRWIPNQIKTFGRLELVSFATGFSLLTFELVAARILAPTIGSSTYVWTSVIGVIIAALSVGFYIGGRLADTRNKATDVAWLLLLASATVVLTKLWYLSILDNVSINYTDPRLQAVMASLFLFAPTSFLIGITSPYLAKLNVQSLGTSGQSVANLDMFNSLGGIIGTFVTGFVLFGYIGSQQSLAIVASLLFVTSWLVAPTYRWRLRIGVGAMILFMLTVPAMSKFGVIDIDTPSSHYQVAQMRAGDRPVNVLITGPTGYQSAVFTSGSNDLIFWYTREMTDIAIKMQPDRILVLGGGAFTMPAYLADKLPKTQIDVVEIDPELENIARQYFRYDSPDNVRIIAEDARTYVNNAKEIYDLVLIDVYSDGEIPFTLITKEFTSELAEIVRPGGFVVANVITGESGPCRDAMIAIDAAYRQQWPGASYVRSPEAGDKVRSNYLFMYGDVTVLPKDFKVMPSFGGNVYSDNFVPAEKMHYECSQMQH